MPKTLSATLGLETEDFEDLTRRIVDVAETHAEGRIVSVLEGGYNLSRPRRLRRGPPVGSGGRADLRT